MGAVANLHAAVGRLFLFTLLVSGLDKTRPKTLKVGVLSLYRKKKNTAGRYVQEYSPILTILLLYFVDSRGGGGTGTTGAGRCQKYGQRDSNGCARQGERQT